MAFKQECNKRSYAIERNLISPQNLVFPSRDWIFDFKTRWNHKIRERNAEILSKKRAQSLTKSVEDSFFEKLEKKLNELQIKDKRTQIFNADETGLGTKK